MHAQSRAMRHGEPSGELPEEMERGRRIAGLLTRLERHRRAHREQRVLGDADMRILWLLADGAARTLREIAESLHLEQSTVNRQVNAALAEGLLDRSRPEGASAYQFWRTAKGDQLFEADVAVSLDGYRDALHALGEPAASDFLHLLGRFTEEYRCAVEQTDPTEG